MLFALLQRDLDTVISRADMEEASIAAPQVARGDCAQMQRELFGIVARRLDQDNAQAFQDALAARGFPTEIVAESDLIRLPASFGVAALRIEGGIMTWADIYGRERAAPLSSCVFAAAGRIVRREERPAAADLSSGGAWTGKYGAIRRIEPIRPIRRMEEYLQFRLDCFFSTDPLRVEWSVAEGQVRQLNRRPIRYDDEEEMGSFLRLLADALSIGRTNRGIERFGRPDAPFYPNPRCFDEEIVWHFHQLRLRRA